MSNVTAGNRTDWKDFKNYRDNETGLQVRVQVSDTDAPMFSPRIGFTHAKTGDFTPFGRIVPPYHRGNMNNMTHLRRYAEALLRLCDQVDADIMAEAKALEPNVPQRQHHGHHNKKQGKHGHHTST